jgi:hypothetical protein
VGDDESCWPLTPLTAAWPKGGGGRFIFWVWGVGLEIAVAIISAPVAQPQGGQFNKNATYRDAGLIMLNESRAREMNGMADARDMWGWGERHRSPAQLESMRETSQG